MSQHSHYDPTTERGRAAGFLEQVLAAFFVIETGVIKQKISDEDPWVVVSFILCVQRTWERYLNFIFEGSVVISLIKLVNGHVDNFCDKPRCHFVRKATSISKYVVIVDILFFKFTVK
jgi:hypothetical protein